MKNLLTATLPAMALLALGGCASSGALVNTTESDGVYYSSQDKTTATSSLNSVYTNRSAAGAANPDGYAYSPSGTSQTAPATTDDANPDYQGGTGSATEGYNTSTLGASSDYYASNYYNPSGFGVPYTGPGVSSYNYSPTWNVSPAAYGSPFGYGLGLSAVYGYGGGFGYPYGGFYSPYAYSGFYDPFYSPFYSPYGFGYGSGLSLGFGFGYGGFGYGGFGYPYGFGGYPGYGYGYGRGYYDSYGGGYYSRPVIRPYSAGSPQAGAVLIGGRPSRGGAAYGNGMVSNAPNSVISGGRVGGGVGMGAVAAPNPAGGAYNGPTGRGGRAVTFGDAAGTGVATPAPQGAQQQAAGGRRGFFSGFLGGSGVSNGQPGSQPTGGTYDSRSRGGYNYGQSQSSSGQAQTRDRGFSQPSYQQPSRSFEQRSFSQPSQPSRSFGGGSFGGGGGGGGSFGGGGGGGGRGRR